MIAIPVMKLFLGALIVFLGGALLPIAFCLAGKASHLLGTSCAMLGAVAGMIAAIIVLSGGPAERFQLLQTDCVINPSIALDGLAVFFLMPVFLLVFCSALYAFQSLDFEKSRFVTVRHWFLFNLLALSMALVVTAADSFVFLVAWELMSLSSFFLVVFDLDSEQARRAGWIYLSATHLGTAFIFGFFLVEYNLAGTFDFASFTVLGVLSTSGAITIFFCLLIGFGTKAGMFPLHCWLPEAHTAAPSHISALMSGVMIKCALYGFLRFFTFLPVLPPWCGLVVAGIGITGSLYGIAMAIQQTDFKKSLAYSTIENVGIIMFGLGLWLYCGASGQRVGASLALAGALLHVWNHALFKGLLFLGAGSVYHASGTRIISRLGGLLRPMPFTGGLMLTGAAAISALPPLNGFISELLIYLGLFQAGLSSSGGQAFLYMVFAVLLALTGGLVLLAMTRIVGMVFCGEPRSDSGAIAHEAGWPMLAAMLIPALLCLAIGVFPLAAMGFLAQPLMILAPGSPNPAAVMPLPFGPAWSLGVLSAIVAVAGILALRYKVRRKPRNIGTWACGFWKTVPKMAYTAGGYAQLAQEGIYCACLKPVYTMNIIGRRLLFAAPMIFTLDSPDPVLQSWLTPLFRGCGDIAHFFRRLQAGRLNVYIFYMFLTTVLLLGWSFLLN